MKSAISAATAKYPMAQCSSYLVTGQVGILEGLFSVVLKKENAYIQPSANRSQCTGCKKHT